MTKQNTNYKYRGVDLLDQEQVGLSHWHKTVIGSLMQLRKMNRQTQG